VLIGRNGFAVPIVDEGQRLLSLLEIQTQFDVAGHPLRFWGRSPSCVYENCCFTSAAIHTSQIGAAWPALLTVCPLVRPKLRSKSSQDLSLSARPPVRRSTVRLRAPVRVRGLGLPCRRAV